MSSDKFACAPNFSLAVLDHARRLRGRFHSLGYLIYAPVLLFFGRVSLMHGQPSKRHLRLANLIRPYADSNRLKDSQPRQRPRFTPDPPLIVFMSRQPIGAGRPFQLVAEVPTPALLDHLVR